MILSKSVLNDNINEFDGVETPKLKKHSIKECLQRIILIIDEKLFEKTYQEEYERQNKEIAMLQSKLIVVERNLKSVYKEKNRLEKRLSKYE